MTQAQKVDSLAENRDLIAILQANGLEVRIVNESDQVKEWAVMSVWSPGLAERRGCLLFQEGKLKSCADLCKNLTNA